MSLEQQMPMTAEFNQYATTKILHQLSKVPFDLTKEETLTPERMEHFSSRACGLKFFYGMERVTDDIMEALRDLASEANALRKMRDMQSGHVMNRIEGFPSENRPVLHTAMRDLFEDGSIPEGAKYAVDLAKKEHEKLKKFLSNLESTERFTDLVAVAIGGSDLGPRSVYSALSAYQKPGRRAHFIGNIDPDEAAQVLSGIDLEKTLVLVVSKSGTTLETVVNEAFLRRFFEDKGLVGKEHFIAVTGQGSPMDDTHKYLECFYLWDFVGGRFSTTAMAGAVLLSFAFGYEVFLSFLRGAHFMDKNALEVDFHSNLPLLLAMLGIWNRNFLNYPTVALVAYSQALARFPAHVQQVDMESNGKHIDRYGRQVTFQTSPIIWGEPGTCAQHSFFQMLHQGTSIVPIEFIGFKECIRGCDSEFNGTTSQEKLLANLFAQAIALATGKHSDNPNKEFQGNRPSSILLANRLTPEVMGAIFALYEHKVAFQGFIWGINSFDQEGVQLGKVLADKIIQRFAAKRGASGGSYPLADFFLNASF